MVVLALMLTVVPPAGQPSVVYAATSGPLYPGTVVSTSSAPYTGITWVTPANAGADDTAYAVADDAAFDTGVYTYRLWHAPTKDTTS